jgi:hypothetical protein
MSSTTHMTGICHIIIESFAPVVKIAINQVDLTFRPVYMYKIATKLLVFVQIELETCKAD